MSRSVDKRIVEMDLNNEQFEKNAKTSIGTIQKLKQALNFDNAEDGFYRIERASSSVNLTPILNSIDELTNKFNAFGIFGIEVMRKISDAAIQTGEKIWNATIGQIKSGGSARALNIANAQFKLEGLGVAWKEASKDISAAVDGTAYGFDAAANTAAQLATAGIELGEAYGGMAHALKAVSGIAAMTNSSYEEIGYIFSQIASAGRLMGQDAMQISTRGINVTATLAKQLGKTTEEIKKMQEKGEISFAMFAEAMNDAFGDQATKANETFQGAVSNVKAALSRIGEIWYGPFYNAAITPLNKIREAINKIKKAFDDGDESTEDFKTRLTELMNIVSNIFSYLVENVDLTFFNNIAEGANMVLDVMNDIGHAIEKTLGIFKTDKAVEENEKLAASLKDLTEAELQAAKDIWITGKYGNGQDRINNLLAAGFTEEGARRVQLAINKFIDSNYEWAKVEEAVGKQAEENDKKMGGLSQTITSKLTRAFVSAKNAASLLAESVGNVASGVWNIVKLLANAFLKYFNFDLIIEDIESIIGRIKDLTESFKNFATNSTLLKSIITGIFITANNVYRVVRSIASIANTLLSSVITVVKEIFSEVDFGEVSIVKFTDKIATWAEKLAQAVKSSGIFVTILRRIVDVVKDLINYAKQLPSVLEPFFEKTKKNLDILLDRFKELTGIDVAAGVKNAWDSIKNFFTTLSDPATTIASAKTAFTKWAENVRDAILAVFASPAILFDKLKEWFKNAFESIKSNPKAILPSGLFKGVGDLFRDILFAFDGIDLNSVVKVVRNVAAVVLIISGVLLAIAEKKLVENLTKPVTTVKEAMGKVVDLVKFFRKTTDRLSRAVEIDLLANAFLKVAMSVAILAASIVGLGMIDYAILAKGLTAVLGCVIALTVAVVAYNKSVDPKALKMLDSTLIQFGISIGIIGLLAIKFGSMDYESLAKGVVMMGILSSVFLELALINQINSMSGSGSNDFAKNIRALVIAIDLMIPVVKIIGEMSAWSIIKGLVAMTLVLGELSNVAVALGIVSDFVNSSEIRNFALCMIAMAAAMDVTLPFLVMMGKMKLYDAVQAVASFAVVMGSIAATIVISAKQLKGLDVADTLVFAASMSVIILAMDTMIPLFKTLGELNAADEGGAFNVVKSLIVLVGALAGLLTLMSMFTISTDIFVIAAAMAASILAISTAVPGLVALASVDQKKLWSVVGALSVIGIVFTTLIGILAYINAGTAYSVFAIMAVIAIGLGEIAFTIIAGAVAIGIAAASIAEAFFKISKSVETISNVDTDKVDKKSKTLIQILGNAALEFVKISPKIQTAITAFFSMLFGVYEDLRPKVLEFFLGAINTIVTTVIAIVPTITQGIMKAVILTATTFLEWITDESGGKSILERIGNAIIDALIIVLDVLTARIGEIATWLADFVIAVIVAATDVLNQKGDAFNKAWSDFMMAIGGYIYSASETLKDTMMEVGKNILKYMWDGVKNKWEKEVKPDIEDGVEKAIQAVKDFFGIRDGDNTGSAFYKIGVKNIELLGEGIKAAWEGGNKLKTWLSEQIGGFIGEMLDDIAGGVDAETGEAANKMGLAMHGMVPQMLWKAFRMRSPSRDMWEAGKNLILGLINGVKDNLGVGELSIGDMLGDLKDSFLGNFGAGEGNGSFMDNIMSMLGIDDENTFSLTPILDTSQFDKDYSSFADGIGLDSNYNFGSTTSSLGSDIGVSTYGGISQSGFTSENVAGLRTDVQDIAERIGRLEVRMDTGALVGALYAGIDEKLGEKQILAGRGVYA